MRELLNIFTPEISPIHKVDFSIAAQLEPKAQTVGKVIPAGTVLKGDFLKDPQTNKAEIVTDAIDATVTGILMHDVVIPEGHTATSQYSVGVMIEGVVYEDVMAKANGTTVWSGTPETYLLPLGIRVYGAKTIGLSR